MQQRIPISLAAIMLCATAGAAMAQSRGNENAEQNVRAGRQYEQALCSNPAFRAKRIAQECGPVTDPELHKSCIASFACGVQHRRSNKAPPSETIR